MLARYYKTKCLLNQQSLLLQHPLSYSLVQLFAGPYVNLEATGSYPDGAYTAGSLEAVLGYEGTTTEGLGWYISGGPTATHTEAADEFGDIEFVGYLGASYDKFYGEISGVTAEDDIDWGAKAGVKFTF